MKIIISGAFGKIIPRINPHSQLSRRLYDILAFRVKDYEFIKLNYEWDGVYHFYKRATSRFKSGLIDMVQYVLMEENGEYAQVIDVRCKGEQVDFKPLSSYCQLRGYQSSTILTSLIEEGGVIEMPTQSGKTLTMLETARRIGRRTLIIVHTKDLLDQMRVDIKKWFGYSDAEIGQIGAGKVTFGDYTIATIQSLRKLLEDAETDHKIINYGVGSYRDRTNIASYREEIFAFVNTVGTLLIDEGHHIPARDFVQVHEYILGNIRYVLVYSASPYRDDHQDMHLFAIGGQKIVDISNSFLIRKGYLREQHVRVIDNPKIENYPETGSYWEKFNAIVMDNDYCNEKTLEVCRLELDSNNQVLLLVAKKEHGYILRELIKRYVSPNVRFICSDSGSKATYRDIEYSVDKRSESLGLFRERIINILVATQIADEGLALRCDAVILACRGKSGTKTKQRSGRPQEVYPDPVTGQNRTKCSVYIYHDHDRPFDRHYTQAMALMETEPAWVIHKNDRYSFS